MDTIFALASARGKAGISVVRLSGDQAHSAVRRMCGDLPPARQASLRALRDAEGELIDRGVVLVFDAGASFTGEESAELQLHGSPAVVAAVLGALSKIDGCRMAEPGEFTRRALENERLDIAQVEGLADLIDAETEAQRRQALRVFSGALGTKAAEWREKLIQAAALLEATIDFADEEVPVDVAPDVLRLIDNVQRELRREARGTKMAERIRDGFEVAIVGPPNVGKSTLLNMLAGRDAAITSEVAGTTRDVIEVRMDLRGLPVTLLDTAGLRESQDAVETLGIARARDRAEAADLRVFLVGEAGERPDIPAREGDIVAVAKADVVRTAEFGVSGKTGLGVDELVERIAGTLENRASGAMTATHERHRVAMVRAVDFLDAARLDVEKGGESAELAADNLRGAIGALETLVGHVDVEHILDEIFARFCLGK